MSLDGPTERTNEDVISECELNYLIDESSGNAEKVRQIIDFALAGNGANALSMLAELDNNIKKDFEAAQNSQSLDPGTDATQISREETQELQRLRQYIEDLG